jgi:hypothetical protein
MFFNEENIPESEQNFIIKISNRNETIDPIIIDGNWSLTAQTYNWCSGTGEIGDPFIIEDISINGNNSSYCLFINNSYNEYFKIENCTFYNSPLNFPAIVLNDANFGTFININCSYNYGGAIRIQNCSDMIFRYFNISYNQFGVELKKDCVNNIFTHTHFMNNFHFGLNVTHSSSSNNNFYNNQFFNNNIHANDYGSDNSWDNDTIGNFWDDYGTFGEDLDDDGIGDEPYNISGNANSQDRYPIWDDDEDINPKLVINSPSDNSRVKNPPSINVTVFDMNYDSLWYEINGEVVFLENHTEEPLDQVIWNSLSNESEFIIRFFANDTLGNINDSIHYTLYKDIIAPRLTIHEPKASETFGIAPPEINLSIIEPYLDKVWYQLKNDSFSSINYSWYSSINNSVWEQFGNGTVEIILYANDTASNIGSQYVICFKDIISPEIIINSPEDESYHNSPPEIDITAIDPNLESLWYKVEDYIIFINNSVSENIDSEIWNFLPDEGVFVLEIFANDSLGNLNCLNLTLYKDILIPTLIVNNPTNHQYYNSAPTLNISVFDTYFDPGRLTYYIEGYAVKYLTNGVAKLLDTNIWTDLNEGMFKLYINAYDKADNVNDTLVLTLYKDTEAPNLIINLPETGNDKFNSSPTFNIGIYDPNFNQSWYRVFQDTSWVGLEHELLNNTDQILESNIWNALAQGQFEVHIFANDSFGHLNSDIILSLYKDNIIPIIIVNSFENGDSFNDVPKINAEYYDTNYDSFWYKIRQNSSWIGDEITLQNATDQFLEQEIWNNLTDGYFKIYFYANDTFSNQQIITITLIKDTTAPILVINSPVEGASYENAPIINVTAYDYNLRSLKYDLIGFPYHLETLINNTAEPLN